MAIPQRWRYALLAFATHAAVIGASLVPSWRALPTPSSDEVTYIRPAQNMLHHGVFSSESAPPYLWEPYRTPGYPLLIAGSLALTGSFASAMFYAACTAAAAAAAAMTLVREWGGGAPAQRLAGWLVALHPNSLGLAGFILTDAVVGHLFVVWALVTWWAVKDGRWRWALASAALLAFLQSMKPTLVIGAMLLGALGLVAGRRRRALAVVGALVAASAVVPAYLGWHNWRDHGVFVPTLHGVNVAREHLQAGVMAASSGESFAVLRQQFHDADLAAASQGSDPAANLYALRQAVVQDFTRQHRWAIGVQMAREVVRQALAPLEYIVILFNRVPPPWLRGVGSLGSVLMWTAAFTAMWSNRRRTWPAAGWSLCIAGFFLLTGAMASLAGARLRFPADMALVPWVAMGAVLLHRHALARVRGMGDR